MRSRWVSRWYLFKGKNDLTSILRHSHINGCGMWEGWSPSVLRVQIDCTYCKRGAPNSHFSINDINGLVAIVLSRGVLQVEKGHSLVPKVKCQIYWSIDLALQCSSASVLFNDRSDRFNMVQGATSGSNRSSRGVVPVFVKQRWCSRAASRKKGFTTQSCASHVHWLQSQGWL